LSEETTRKYRGVDVPSLKYRVKDESWDINPDGHLPKYTEAINEILHDFKGKMIEFAESRKSTTLKKSTKKSTVKKMTFEDAKKLAIETNRKILNIALVPKSKTNPNGFNFDEAAAKYGWTVIDGMILDLRTFLVVHGGREEYLHSKQRYNQAKQDGFLGLEA